MSIIIHVPANLKGLVGSLEALLKSAAEQVARGRTGGPAAYEAFQEEVQERLGAVERDAHQACLSALDIDADKVTINGVIHARVGQHDTTFMTGAGGVVVNRGLFRPLGQRNAPAVDLVALRAGAVAGVWLPGTARDMGFLLQKGTSREAEDTARELGRNAYSRSSFEDVGHAVGARYLNQRKPVEQALIVAYEVPAAAHSVSAAIDRVAVPMEEPRPRPVGRPRKDAPKNPVSRVFRMAYCATITLHDKDGEAIHTIRYGTMPEGCEKTLIAALGNDVRVLRAKRPDLRLVVLSDGAPEMKNLLDAEFEDEIVELRLLDFYHLQEKLAPAANVLYPETAAQHRVAWKLALLNKSNAGASILQELLDSGKEDVVVGNNRPVHDAITYLTNNAERMNYARARSLGLPIASGNVEATCKSLVGLRMVRCGSRWKTNTGEHIIQLRALALSDRWDAAMSHTLRVPPVVVKRAA